MRGAMDRPKDLKQPSAPLEDFPITIFQISEQMHYDACLMRSGETHCAGLGRRSGRLGVGGGVHAMREWMGRLCVCVCMACTVGEVVL